MNKLIRRLAMAFVGISMAVGVGVAVGAKPNAIAASAGVETKTATIDYADESITGNSNGTSYVKHRNTFDFDGTKVYFGGTYAKQSSSYAMRSGKTPCEIIGNIDPKFDVDNEESWVENIPTGSVGAIPGAISQIKVQVVNDNSVTRGFKLSLGTSQIVTNSSYSGGTAYSGTTATGSGYTYDSSSKTYTIAVDDSQNYTYFAITGNSTSYTGIKSIVISYKVVVSDDPFVLMSTDSISGYTLQEKSLTATFGNLLGDGVEWSQTSDDGGEVTFGTPDTSIANKSTVTITLKTKGNVSVVATDNGGTASASCTISISASSITISLDKDSVSIQETRKEQVTATVNAVGAYSNAVTWSSDNESIATVDETGLITGVAVGTTTVRCTSNDYPAETKAVTVNVAAKTYQRFISISNDNLRSIDTTKAANSYARYDGTGEQGDYQLLTSNVCLNSSKLQFKRGAGYMNNVTAFSFGIHLIKVTTFGTSSAAYTVKFANSDENIATSGVEGTKIVVGNDHYWIPKSSATFFYISDTTTASSNQLKVDSIDVFEETNAAFTFANDFVTAMATPCADENANNKTAVSAIWSTYKSGFEALTSDTKTEFGTSENATITQARTLYLHCVERYSLSTWTGAPSGSAFVSGYQITNHNNSTLLVIIVISAISLIAVSSYFVIRRRKENN